LRWATIKSGWHAHASTNGYYRPDAYTKPNIYSYGYAYTNANFNSNADTYTATSPDADPGTAISLRYPTWCSTCLTGRN
jgi:hypothetical protein